MANRRSHIDTEGGASVLHAGRIVPLMEIWRHFAKGKKNPLCRYCEFLDGKIFRSLKFLHKKARLSTAPSSEKMGGGIFECLGERFEPRISLLF